MPDPPRAAAGSVGRPRGGPSAGPERLDLTPGCRDGWITARWEDQLPALISSLGLATDGVVQVGAHVGQEVPALTRCGFRRPVMMEPNSHHAAALRQQSHRHHRGAGLPGPAAGLPAREVVLTAAGRERGQLVLHVTEYDQQASLLRPLSPMAVVRRDTVAARYEGGATPESIGAYMRSQAWTQIAVWVHARPHVADVAWLAPTRSAAVSA